MLKSKHPNLCPSSQAEQEVISYVASDSVIRFSAEIMLKLKHPNLCPSSKAKQEASVRKHHNK